jgi:hypothetical protein
MDVIDVKTRNAKRNLTGLIHFLNKRSQIEENYANQLQKLA